MTVDTETGQLKAWRLVDWFWNHIGYPESRLSRSHKLRRAMGARRWPNKTKIPHRPSCLTLTWPVDHGGQRLRLLVMMRTYCHPLPQENERQKRHQSPGTRPYRPRSEPQRRQTLAPSSGYSPVTRVL